MLEDGVKHQNMNLNLNMLSVTLLLVFPRLVSLKLKLMYNFVHADKMRTPTFARYNIAHANDDVRMCPAPKWAMPNG